MRRLRHGTSIIAAAVATLFVASSAHAQSVDNDCVTWQFQAPSSIASYINMSWSGTDGESGSEHLPTSATSYGICGATPNTTYTLTLQECIDLLWVTDCGSKGSYTLSTKPSLIIDGGFENLTSEQMPSWWLTEGTAPRGVDVNLGNAHTGKNNAWINTTGTGWNAMTFVYPLGPSTTFHFTAWIRTSSNVTAGYFGIRNGAGKILKEVEYGPFVGEYQRVAVDIQTPDNWDDYTMYIGYWAPGWIQVDDVWLTNDNN